MSFSKQVKEELSKFNNLANKEEVKFEFLGYLASNHITKKEGIIKYSTENDYNIDRFAKIIRNMGIEDFNITVNGKIFSIEFGGEEEKNDFVTLSSSFENLSDLEFKAFMRGLFMGSGSINNPEKKYHLECGIRNQEDVPKIVAGMSKKDIFFKQRENMIYSKDGEEISKFLAFIGAVKSVLKFEEIRVERHMNNKVNRLVNCKTANLNKVLNASVEQVEAIRKLKQNGEFEKLENNLKEIAELRLANPDMPFVELGQKLSTPIGKSGVNYRLKKIIKIAEEGNKK